MWKNIGLFILIALMFGGCAGTRPSSAYTIYVIPEGKQNSVTAISVFEKEELQFHALFNNTAIYSTKDTSNQADINKLYGFSDCNSQHQENSARFGWRWYQNSLQIFAYCYANGERSFKYISSVDLNKDYEYSLKIQGSQYVFSLNGVTVTMPRGCSGGGGVRYHLFPYFGGDEVAPHDISIAIRNI